MPYQFQYIEKSQTSIDIQHEYLLSHKALVEQAIMRGKSATYSITDNYPKASPGTTFYSEVIASLRELLIPEGFEKLSISNIELTVSRELGFALYFCRGDEQTGIESGMPKSLRKKGNAAKNVLGLVTHYPLLPELDDVPQADISIWAITIFADFKNDSYRAELGVPTNIDQRGYIDNFSHRIMLDLNNEIPTPSITDKPIEFTEDVDIEIIKNEQTAT